MELTQKQAIDIQEMLLWLWDGASVNCDAVYMAEQKPFFDELINVLGGIEQVIATQRKRAEFYKQIGG